MFHTLFSSWEYDERDWPSIYLLESVTQTLICMKPAAFVSATSADMAKLLRGVMSLIIADDAKPRLNMCDALLASFFEREESAVREYALRRARWSESLGPIVKGKVTVFSASGKDGPDPGRVLDCIERSDAFKSVLRSDWWARCTNVAVTMDNPAPDRDWRFLNSWLRTELQSG